VIETADLSCIVGRGVRVEGERRSCRSLRNLLQDQNGLPSAQQEAASRGLASWNPGRHASMFFPTLWCIADGE